MKTSLCVLTLICCGYFLNACGGGSSTTHLSQLAITSGTPPNGLVGLGYDGSRRLCEAGTCLFVGGFPLAASGGVAPYVWTWAAGAGSSSVPGLVLYGGGNIGGVPSTGGSYNLVVTASDSESPPAQVSATYTIVITYPPPIISTSPVPAVGAVNVPYPGFTFNATGGAPPLAWSETGALPPGMALATDGALSGEPTATGSFPITVMVQGADHQNAAPQNFTFQIDAQLPTFTPTGSMQSARALHTATLLSNGKVVVIGGVGNNGTGPLGSIEVFDPVTRQFTLTAPHLMTPRSEHTATLLKSGKVLVTGGQDASGNAIADAELFDPNTDSFAPAGTMQSPRTGHTATLLKDGRVLVAGGLDSDKVSLSTAELFDPTTGQFTLATMTGSHTHHAAALLSSGKVLLSGGSSNPTTPPAEIYDPSVNTFTVINVGSLFSSSFLTATLLVDNRVLLAGGEGQVIFVKCNEEEKLEEESTVFAALFDSSAAGFSYTGNMSTSRARHTATLLPGGKVLMAGGVNISAVESGCVLSTNSASLANAELFDPTQGTFALTTSMTTARSRHTATLLPNGGVLVIGGFDANNNPLASAELYH